MRTTYTRTVGGVDITAEIVCGVYLVVCIITGDMYVGSSTDIRRRWRQHRSKLRSGQSSCSRLQACWNVYPEQFSFAILRECAEAELIHFEQVYMDWLKPKLNGTMLAGTTYGHRMTADQRARLRLRPQSVARTHQYRGEQLTIPQIAARENIKVTTLYRRAQTGGPLDAALRTGADKLRVELNGKLVTPKEIAEEFDLPLTTVYSRVRLGWTGEALTQPRKRRARNSR